jgi:uncharacterized protein YxjI
MAAKVHPNSSAEPSAAIAARSSPAVLTVWRKSLLFNCDGFTVFNAKGDLAFRVDCYGKRRAGAEVVLMDAAGRPLLTVRRKHLLSLAERWLIYDGDNIDSSSPLLSVRRSSSSSAKALAYVVTSKSNSKAEERSYVVEGSYGRRACAVRDADGDTMAEVRRKDSVGDDVFRLVADPRLGAPMAMGFVIALDDMFRGGRSRASSSSLARSLLRRTWSKSFWSPWMTTTRASSSPSTQLSLAKQAQKACVPHQILLRFQLIARAALVHSSFVVLVHGFLQREKQNVVASICDRSVQYYRLLSLVSTHHKLSS